MINYLQASTAPARRANFLFIYFRFLTYVLLPFLLLSGAKGWAQTAGDYRSNQTGDWNAVSTWQRYNGYSWTALEGFPVVAATASSFRTATGMGSGTTHTVSLPTGIQSGDLLLIFWADPNTADVAPTMPTGWTELYVNTSNNRTKTAWYKVADGTEGASIDVTAGEERSAHNAYRIEAGSYTGVPVSGTLVTANSMTPDPPTLTSGFGSTYTLWLAAVHSLGDGNSLANPANYTDQINAYTGAGGNQHARMITARRELITASEDPGTFNSYSANRQWGANTVAIQGVVAGAPTSANGAINIRNGHIVTVTASTSVDQCTIESGGQVIVNASQTWTIANGTGTDLTVGGTLSNSGAILMTGTAAFNAGGTYDHVLSGGNVPTAIWDVNSNCNIFEMNTLPSGLGQIFGNLSFIRSSDADLAMTSNINCAGDFAHSNSGAGVFSIASGGTGRVLTVGGDFTTSSGTFRMVSGNANATLAVGGDFMLSGTGIFIGKNGAGTMTLTIDGNYTQTGGTFNQRVSNNAVTNPVIVGGDFTLSGGTYDLCGVNNTVGGLTVAGDFSFAGGTLTKTAITNNGYGMITFNGSTLQTFTTTGGTTSGAIHFTINNSGDGVALSGPLTILNSAEVIFQDGVFFTTGTNLLTFNDNATTTGASGNSFVDGPVRKIGNDIFTFPVGKNGKFAPIAISAPSNASHSFQAEYFNSAPASSTLGTGIAEVSQKEYWDLDRTGNSQVTVTIGFTGNSMATMPDLANLRVARYDESLMTPAWVSVGNTATTGSETTSGTLTSAPVSSFSFFTLGSSVASNPLPVELTAFTATPKGKKVQLDWRTANEFNNAFFYIERSADGRDFEEIGVVQGAGTSREILDYVFTDEFPLTDWSYYRLRQEDTDGKFSHSPVQAVRMQAGKVEQRLVLFPNPASIELNLKTESPLSAGDYLEILDRNGQLWQRLAATETAGLPIDISQLPAGTYFLRLRAKTGIVTTTPFVKQ